MTNVFRDSQYIDFNNGIVHVPPMELFKKMSQPLSIDDKITLFECRVDVWQLGPAIAVLKQIESNEHPSIWSHSAYGIIWILTSYFEMIGKVLNPNSKIKNTAGGDFNAGFRDVYPNYTITKEDGQTLQDVRIQYAWSALRNGIYHLGYTKSGVVLHNMPEYKEDFEGLMLPKGDNRYTVAFGVNPHRLTRTITNHFPTFISRLRDPAQADLREKFLEFLDDFHVAPDPKPLA